LRGSSNIKFQSVSALGDVNNNTASYSGRCLTGLGRLRALSPFEFLNASCVLVRSCDGIDHYTVFADTAWTGIALMETEMMGAEFVGRQACSFFSLTNPSAATRFLVHPSLETFHKLGGFPPFGHMDFLQFGHFRSASRTSAVANSPIRTPTPRSIQLVGTVNCDMGNVHPRHVHQGVDMTTTHSPAHACVVVYGLAARQNQDQKKKKKKKSSGLGQLCPRVDTHHGDAKFE
jgi:hypothetical protein